MSVINRVLKDLDRQGAQATALAPGVRRVDRPSPAPLPWRAGSTLGLAALGVVLGAAAWWLWPQPEPPPPPPAPATSAPMPAAAPAEAPPPPVGQPSLKLALELRQPPPSVSGADAKPATTTPRQQTRVARELPPAAPPRLAPQPRLEHRLPEVPTQGPPLVVKEAKPTNPARQAEELWRQSSLLLEQGRPREAQPLLEQALNLDAAHLGARQALAVLALEGGRRPAAEALLREGTRLHPEHFWFSRSLAQSHIQQGDVGQAAQVLMAGLGPQARADDWALYASTLGQLGRPLECAAAYREALKRDAGQGTWWVGLGVALEQADQRTEAANAYARALQTRLSPALSAFAEQKARELK